jgi:hypothetical protein
MRQTEEMLAADPLLVSAWLDRVSDPDVENPASWFLTGVRSGIFPHQLADQRRAQAIHLAERWIVNAGLFVPDETNVLDELFDGQSAPLRHYAHEEPLREKLLSLWRLERPRGEQTETEYLERALRQRASREAMQRPKETSDVAP